MVKRRNNIATIETPDGEIEGGKWVEKPHKTYFIEGRIEYKTNTFIEGPNGDRTEIKAEFFTKEEAKPDAGFLTINERRYRIIDWIDQQTYCLILLST